MPICDWSTKLGGTGRINRRHTSFFGGLRTVRRVLASKAALRWPRHLHHDQDEWIYVIDGEFEFEVG